MVVTKVSPTKVCDHREAGGTISGAGQDTHERTTDPISENAVGTRRTNQWIGHVGELLAGVAFPG